MLCTYTTGWYPKRTMIETDRQPEQARLTDGTWVSPGDALKTMRSIYRALGSNMIPNRIATVAAMRAQIDDLASFVKDASHVNDPDGEFARRKINETLQSHVIPVEEPDANWTVPPKTAIAVFRAMVVIEEDANSTELYVQEPFADRELLPTAWEAALR